jgi:anti-anti-sigma regulatory factor
VLQKRRGQQQPGIDVEVYWDTGEAVIFVRGDLDGVSAADLAERLIEVDSVLGVLNGEVRRLVVDLADVRFVNQAAARALEAARRRLSPGRLIVVRSPTRAARKFLTPVGLLDHEAGANGQASRRRQQRQRRGGAGNRPEQDPGG